MSGKKQSNQFGTLSNRHASFVGAPEAFGICFSKDPTTENTSCVDNRLDDLTKDGSLAA